jgi:hypothetical protein
MAGALQNLTTSVSGESKLTGEQFTAVFQAFATTAGVPAIAGPLQATVRAGLWALFLGYLADHGFATQLSIPRDKTLSYARGAAPGAAAIAVYTTPPLVQIVTAMLAACPVYTHQRLARTIPDEVSAVLQVQGRRPIWAINNGLPSTIPDRFCFPAAIYCEGISDTQRTALALASRNALPENTGGSILNTAGVGANAGLIANAGASTGGRFLLNF